MPSILVATQAGQSMINRSSRRLWNSDVPTAAIVEFCTSHVSSCSALSQVYKPKSHYQPQVSEYEVRKFNSRNSRSVSLGCWVRQTRVLKHVWTWSSLAITWATDQMSRSFPSSRGSSTCPWYTVGGKISDKNLEHGINIKFCVKVDKVLVKRWPY